MPVKQFLSALAGISKWVDFLFKKRMVIQQQEQVAIDALHAALSKTQIYTAALRKGQVLDSIREAELSELWHQASSKLTFVDPKLSSLCLLKGTYWSEPGNWREEDIAEAHIALDEITDAISKLKQQVAKPSVM